MIKSKIKAFKNVITVHNYVRCKCTTDCGTRLYLLLTKNTNIKFFDNSKKKINILSAFSLLIPFDFIYDATTA